MGIARGANIVRDNLVFGFDSGYGVAGGVTGTRFYPGKPTTNLQSSVQHADGQLYAVQSVSVTYVGEEDGWSKYSLNGSWTAGTYPYSMRVNSTAFTGGVKYSTQCKVKTNVPHKFHYFATNGLSYVNQAMDHSGANSSTLLDEGCYLLKREGFAYTSTTTQPGYLWTRGNSETFSSSTDFVFIKDFMVEQKDRCTPWTATSRSNTASLIDLKRTFSIDVANCSFDTTNQPNFDGTDDYANVASYTEHNQSTGSIEGWVKPTNNGGNRYAFGAGGTNTVGATRALRISGGNWSVVGYGNGTNADWNDIATATTDWQHVVITWSGTTYCFYLDGVKYGPTTRSGLVTPTGNIMRIGAPPFATNSNFIGSIASVKCYDAVLTQAQVTQNFNADRNRFNI